jgi:ABC-2 type transport system ATP-binding protein
MTDIQLQGLRKSFRTPHGRVEAVKGVDIGIARGETVALLGPNGLRIVRRRLDT